MRNNSIQPVFLPSGGKQQVPVENVTCGEIVNRCAEASQRGDLNYLFKRGKRLKDFNRRW